MEAVWRGVREVDEERAERDLGYFVDWLRDFLGYTDEDRRRVLTTATVILPHSRELLDGVYGVMLGHSCTRKYFVDAAGNVDESFLEKRRKTLFEWFAMTAAGSLDARLAAYIEEIAVKHLEIGATGGARVPLAHVEALFGVVEAVLYRRLGADLESLAELVEAQGSWGKMLAAQRALFARAYELRAPGSRSGAT